MFFIINVLPLFFQSHYFNQKIQAFEANVVCPSKLTKVGSLTKKYLIDETNTYFEHLL